MLTLLSVSMGGFPGHASAATPGSQLWAKLYNGPGSGVDSATAMAASPDGSTVFVTGQSAGSTSGSDYATVAYDASTGAKRWAMRYNGPANTDEQPYALGVSPDGSEVFVTGYSNDDFGTVAYDASTGAELWAKHYTGPAGGGCCDETSYALAVSPDSSTVFVTGAAQGSSVTSDYATVAYATATGTKLWAKLYNGSANQTDQANAVGVSPDGSKVFVTGYVNHDEHSFGYADYGTVAYDASTGAQLWVKIYDGPGGSNDAAFALGVSPDGSMFVTGESVGSTNNEDYATLAYDASTGAKLWAKRYNGPGNGDDVAGSLGVSPDGSNVFVTGQSAGSTSGDDDATVAYDASTGNKQWLKRFNGTGNGNDAASDLGVSPDGSKLFVTGPSDSPTSRDYATIAYDTSTGSKLWANVYNGAGNDSDTAQALGVSPDGSTVFVTGESYVSVSRSYDYATVAYSII